MTFYWFGDSWVFGDELELQVADDQQEFYTFASVVSKHFHAECINMSECGSSIASIPLKFKSVVDTINAETDRVFFFLTASHRTSLFDQQGKVKNILPMGYSKHNMHENYKQWYKYFDSPLQRLYNYDCVVNLLYLWCKSVGITCYFSNIFTVEPDSIVDCTPTSAWLLPRDKCIAEWILPVIDANNFSVVADDHPDLTSDQWQQQKIMVDQYIRPGHVHPNVQGHAKIAKHIIEILQNE
jgi:hypothetical protein